MMKKDSKLETYRGLLISFVILALAAVVVVLPNQFHSEAGSQEKQVKKGLVERTESQIEGLENYDIRNDNSKKAGEALVKFRDETGKTAFAIADAIDNFVKGEENLKRRVPSLKIEYNKNIQTPEVITPDIWKKNIERLTAPSSGLTNAEVLRSFVQQNNQLVGMESNQINQLKVVADYTNPSGSMAFAHLEQKINDIPVFQGEVKAGFTKNGEIIRVINNLAADLDYENLSNDFKNPLNAVKSAAEHINYQLKTSDFTRNNAASSDLKTVFGTGDWATTAEKMYFPTEVGVARPAWRVLIWQPVNAFYVIVDAETGTMLWRKNITNDQTQSATYEVYANPLSMINTADSPAPFTPGPVNPTLGEQGALINRTNVTLIGNEGSLSFNNNGWITDGSNSTDGNAVEAGLDLVAPNGVDAPVAGVNRAFSSAWNPPPGSPAPGDAPTIQAARDGAVIQMFYVMNRYHDAMYQLGFTEQAFNFQQNNFSRGGASGDRISAEGQDGAGTDNANFTTPSDGGRGRMQMYIFTGSSPNRDGTADADIIIHEATHGTTNRLHGNASGLNENMSRGMGEGWSDWYAFALLSGSDDPVNGVYAGGGHVLLGGFNAIGTANYYYGIRRFPKATMATTGGPNNRPHNPLTFADIDQTQLNLTDGAFPPMTGPHLSTSASQIHAAGEVWSSALWEVRALMITRLGHVAGNNTALQVVTDAMKISPINPTFIEGRDAIIMAAAGNPADVADIREGFRIRGMGFSAKVNVNDGPTTTRVTEAFDYPNVVMVEPFSVSDAPGDNDEYPEPGEAVLLNIAVENTIGSTVNSVVVNVNGGADVTYGNIADGQTVTKQIPYTIPSNALCGSNHQVTINIRSDSGTRPPVIKSFGLGQPNGSIEKFDGVTAPALPVNWTSTATGIASGWVSRTSNPNSSPNSVFAADIANVGESLLETPEFPVSSSTATLKFKMNHDAENSGTTGYDGIVLDIKIGSGAYQDILTAGGSFVSGGYNVTMSSDFNSPIGGRQAWSGNSMGYKDVEIKLPPTATGQNVRMRWNMATDASLSAVGVDIDDVNLISSYTCGIASSKARADFDGDGKTDISIFRPSEGNWYINGSTDGFSVMHFGEMSDVIVPGDYDGDGKTDVALFRASNIEGTPDFYILNSNGFVLSGAEWGVTGDIPVVGDYDGDGKDDIAVFRDSDATWYILNSSNETATITPFGNSGATPAVGDFNSDGKADLTTFNNGTWTSQLSGGGTLTRNAGATGDILAPADYDGDGRTDQATFRQSNGTWYVWLSDASELFVVEFGSSTDIPVPGDYDGDGRDDFAVYRNGGWWINSSQSGLTNLTTFGLASDMPIPIQARP